MSKFNHIVLQSDFGLSDGAVSAMEGVIVSVNPDITIHHLTHDIPPYDTYLASYRLYQAFSYWPKETVFASIVDPGVGFGQLSLAVKLKTGHIILTPNNGSISHLYEKVGIESAYEIDKEKNLLNKDNHSYTFFGRDLYAYTAARLVSDLVTIESLGDPLHIEKLVRFGVGEVKTTASSIEGIVDIHDVRYGSLWSNIPFDLLRDVFGGDRHVSLEIYCDNQVYFSQTVIIGKSFQDVSKNEPLIYCNSLQKVGIALNQNSFAKAFQIGYGSDWRIVIQKKH